jgi:hypothetical protein
MTKSIPATNPCSDAKVIEKKAATVSGRAPKPKPFPRALQKHPPQQFQQYFSTFEARQ